MRQLRGTKHTRYYIIRPEFVLRRGAELRHHELNETSSSKNFLERAEVLVLCFVYCTLYIAHMVYYILHIVWCIYSTLLPVFCISSSTCKSNGRYLFFILYSTVDVYAKAHNVWRTGYVNYQIESQSENLTHIIQSDGHGWNVYYIMCVLYNVYYQIIVWLVWLHTDTHRHTDTQTYRQTQMLMINLST